METQVVSCKLVVANHVHKLAIMMPGQNRFLTPQSVSSCAVPRHVCVQGTLYGMLTAMPLFV